MLFSSPIFGGLVLSQSSFFHADTSRFEKRRESYMNGQKEMGEDCKLVEKETE